MCHYTTTTTTAVATVVVVVVIVIVVTVAVINKAGNTPDSGLYVPLPLAPSPATTHCYSS